MKISVVMTCYNRPDQLRRTLESFGQYAGRDIEIIVVDDASTVPVVAASWVNLIRIPPHEKHHSNPCIPFNRGIAAATGDVIVIQNAENVHVGDVLGHIADNITDQVVLSYACYAIPEETTTTYRVGDPVVRLQSKAKQAGGPGWYNHSIYNPRGYHFCNAVTRKNMDALGGFDERFANGRDYDDNEILDRMKRLGLTVRIIDDPFVLHQWHPNSQEGVPSNINIYKITQKETAVRACHRDPMPEDPLVSVLICSYRGSKHLAETLRTLVETLAFAPHEILVDIEATPTGLRNTARRYQRLFDKASGKLIVKSDDDVAYGENWLRYSLKALTASKAPYVSPYNPGPNAEGTIMECDHIGGLVWVFRRELWERVPYGALYTNCLDSGYAHMVKNSLGRWPVHTGRSYCEHTGHGRTDRDER